MGRKKKKSSSGGRIPSAPRGSPGGFYAQLRHEPVGGGEMGSGVCGEVIERATVNNPLVGRLCRRGGRKPHLLYSGGEYQ